MTKTEKYILPYNQVSMQDLREVGGKNASLGEMYKNLASKGILIPDGFAVTSTAYWNVLDENNIREKLAQKLDELDTKNFSNLREVSKAARELIIGATIPKKLETEIKRAYRNLCIDAPDPCRVAVRSSATAEDLPTASFAGQQETYLNISGDQAVLDSYKMCISSLFTERAIKYRFDNGFKHMEVALSVGVQQMVRSDMGCSGVLFTLEPETGFKDVIVINGNWGLGENVVQGIVDPDEIIIFKPSLVKKKKSIISKKMGSKLKTMIYTDQMNHHPIATTTNIDTPLEKQNKFVLNDNEVEQLASWAMIIERHYKMAMDIEWAKDGLTNKIYIVQARPETVHSSKKDANLIYTYEIKERGIVLTTGTALGTKITSGRARILKSPKDADQLQEGEILVTDITNPDWDPIMKKAGAIITNKGGRTSHAAIVARELSVVAVVGTGNATEVIKDGQKITVSCAEGKKGVIYDGEMAWSKKVIDTKLITLPKTEVMFILADPDKAFQHAALPNNGVGLMRIEFVVSNTIKIHPMALVKFDELKDADVKVEIEKLTINYKNKTDYFVDQLSQAIATIAAAFYPKEVIVRMSDFKTNEYRNLIGGKQFEPEEENPMLGFRGASRYYSPLYKEGFELECEAIKIVRNEMGLKNVKVMIPFCRTVEEGKKVVEQMAEFGLKRGENNLEIYVMVEIPSNVILADKFAEVFDGFSIGSNDLTQLTLGLDRDSALISSHFNENNPAVKILISQVIKVAKEKGKKIGLCGQAPSDFPEFATFLVEQHIDSISFNPDALISGIANIKDAETTKAITHQEFLLLN